MYYNMLTIAVNVVFYGDEVSVGCCVLDSGLKLHSSFVVMRLVLGVVCWILVLLPCRWCLGLSGSGAAAAAAAAAAPSTASLKAQLLKLASRTNRGISATPGQRNDLNSIVASLAMQNPTPKLCHGCGLQGDWSVIYSDSRDVLFLGLLPGLIVSEIKQSFSSDDASAIVNEIEFLPSVSALLGTKFGGVSLRIKLSGEVVKPRRIERKLMGFEWRPSGIQLPLPEFARAQGYFDTTYLDDDIWIIEAKEGGGTFVHVRSS
jgi:hypothetical protein